MILFLPKVAIYVASDRRAGTYCRPRGFRPLALPSPYLIRKRGSYPLQQRKGPTLQLHPPSSPHLSRMLTTEHQLQHALYWMEVRTLTYVGNVVAFHITHPHPFTSL